MCYAIPGRVVEVNGRDAVVDYFGERRRVVNEFKDVGIGEYVYAQGGLVVQRIPEREAKKTLAVWKELFFKLKETDDRISNRKIAANKVGAKLASITAKAWRGEALSEGELASVLKADGESEVQLVYSTANRIRHRSLKNSCCVHGIIEFSNQCINDCLYCGLREGSKDMRRYRMTVDEVVKIAREAVNVHGFKSLVLQSGEDPWYTTDKLVEIVEGIMEHCGVLLFMSVGSRDEECYRRMYDAGARGVLIRFETSNPELYARLHVGGPKSSLEDRIKTIKHAKKLGYLVATGSLIGLPGQKLEDIIDDVILTKSLGADMFSFGPVIPAPGTPLAETEKVGAETVLKAIATTRFADPQAKILVTTAFETLDRDGRRRGLLAGANSLMINVTPMKYRRMYAPYPGRPDTEKDVAASIDETLKLLYSLGRAPTDLGVGESA